MRVFVFGLTVRSSRGNGHATLWRGLARARSRAGHHLELAAALAGAPTGRGP